MSAGSDQRARLIDAMTQVAARHGYAHTSIVRIVRQAGVSKATFYDHFADKEACFLAAFELAAAPLQPRLAELEGAADPEQTAAELFDRLLLGMARQPAAARILLVESLAAGAGVRRAHGQLLARFEQALERSLLSPERSRVPMLSPHALVDGVFGILMIRSFRGETGELTELREDLFGWLEAHAVAAEDLRVRPGEWKQLGAGLEPDPYPKFGADALGRRLPRGSGALSSEEVAAKHRKRIVAAVAQLTRDKGYAAMTVTDIVKAAAVTRDVFYGLFRGKEEAFIAAQTTGLEESVALSATSFFTSESWRNRIWTAMRALLSYISSQPDLIYVDVVECFAAGPASIHRAIDNRLAFTLFLEEGYQEDGVAENLPRLASEAIASAIFGLFFRQVASGNSARTTELLPEAAYLALAPFTGPDVAADTVIARTAAMRAGDAPPAPAEPSSEGD